MPLIPELGRQRQVDVKLKDCLVYRANFTTSSKTTQRNPVSINKQKKDFTTHLSSCRLQKEMM